ncbi:6-phospho-3-hexuloisomerase [Streptomyces koyangensis]|uniref:6-phospho-3-hexuloisomerase n=1 Tax=Streptomyces koyangensis TaxID=188770 RepID=UPI000A51FB23
MIQKSDQPTGAAPAGGTGTTGVAFPPQSIAECERQFVAARRTVLDENGVALQAVAPAEAAALAEAISQAGQVVVIGAGRSKLAVEAFAMRLAHMGLSAHVSSDVTAPPVGDGDLVIACSGSGETAGVLQLADSARQAGARLAAVLAHPQSQLGRAADLRVVLREYDGDGTVDASQQFIGTLFEQSALLLFDTVVLALERAGAVDPESMRRRHTNME